ncbi:MAG: VWA domain-containing protein [Pseudomonadota bacterium]
MSRVTRFAGRDPGPAARIAGFMAHLRTNGLRLGVAETELALDALTHVETAKPDHVKRAMKAVCTGCQDEAERFDALFDAFWLDAGRVRTKAMPTRTQQPHRDVHSSRNVAGQLPETDGAGAPSTPESGDGGEAESDGIGKLIASEVRNLARKDLRDLISAEEIAEAEAVAYRLGQALRQRRARRIAATRRGDRLHFRRTIRASLASGGEPLRLVKSRRPDRTLRIAALCDVSGSMSVYAKVFVAFLGGLMRSDPSADAYLFHTRLVRITEALRDKDTMRGIGRMSLMADGFGGGSKIGECLGQFADGYAKRFVNNRTAVLILSDGYDTGPPGVLGDALARLSRRGCRILWLNPLKGWRDYRPIAGGMAAAMPHLDLFAAASTLGDLAALEPELIRL